MGIKQLIGLISILLIFLGCATKWHHLEGHGKEVQKLDVSSCKAEAYSYATDKLTDPSHPRGPKVWKFAFRLNYDVHYHECMNNKGWELAYYDGNVKDKHKSDSDNCTVQGWRYARDKLFEPSHPQGPRGWRYGYKHNLKSHYQECMQSKGW
ncbi:MAG: hypothetical protein ABFR82_00975 [Nitrospirota bacterium]